MPNIKDTILRNDTMIKNETDLVFKYKRENLDVFNTRVNMMIIEAVLHHKLYKCFYKREFDIISQESRSNQFSYGYYTENQIKRFVTHLHINEDYFNGSKRFFIARLEQHWESVPLTLSKIETEYAQNQLDIPYGLIPSDIIDNICYSHYYGGSRDDPMLGNIMYYISKKEISPYTPFKKVAVDISHLSNDFIAKTSTEILLHYIEMLESHLQTVRCLYHISKLRKEDYDSRELTAPFTEYIDIESERYFRKVQYVKQLIEENEKCKEPD